MKAKRLGSVIVVLAVCAAMCFSLWGCSDSHTHNYEWTVTTPATCETDGVETGKCSCGNTTTRKVDKLGHDYGEWHIEIPTEAKVGKATNTCKNDATHTLEVELPALTAAGTGYTVTGDAQPKTYTYAHEAGDISFTTYAIFSAGDAVAAALANRGNVKKGSAESETVSVVDTWYVEGAEPDDLLTEIFGNEYDNHQMGYKDASFASEWEFGDGFTYVKSNEDSDREFWYSKTDSGDIFAVQEEHTVNEWDDTQIDTIISRDNAATEDSFYGATFAFQYVVGLQRGYGVEGYIDYLYRYGSTNSNGDFTQSIETVEGKKVYKFSFGHMSGTDFTGDQLDDNLLHVISVQFTLDSGYVVDSAIFDAKSYQTRKNINSQNSWEPMGIYLKTDDGYRIQQGQEGNWAAYQAITVSQKSELADGETIAPNKYVYDEMIAQSFSLMQVEYGWGMVGEEWGQIETELGAVTDSLSMVAEDSVTLKIKDLQPSTANFNFDEMTFWIRRSGEEDEQVLNEYEGGSAGHIVANCNPTDKTIAINSYIKGDFTFVIKTTKVEKVFALSVDPIAPWAIGAQVYNRDEITGDISASQVNGLIEVYAGQKIYFGSSVANPWYEDDSYTVSGVDGSLITIDNVTYFEGGESVVKEVNVFTPTAPGYYRITLTSNSYPDATADIDVYVEAAPDVANVIKGRYAGGEGAERAEITFTPASSGSTSGSATLTIGETDDVKANITFDYNYASGNISISNISSQNSYTVNSLKLTDSYNFVLTYSNAFGKTVAVKLTDATVIVNGILGSYTLTGASEESPVELTAELAGEYKLTFGAMFAYTVNDEVVSEFGEPWAYGSTTVELAEGDVLKLWTGEYGSGDCTVDIVARYFSDDVHVASEYTLYVGAHYDIGTLADLDWESSDTSVVTVTDGELVAVATGFARVTVNDFKFNVRVTSPVLKTGKNEIAITSGTIVFTFAGDADSEYEFTATAGVTIAVGSELGEGSLNITTGDDGNMTVTVTVADADGLVTLNISKASNLVGDGTKENPYEIELGVEYTLYNVPSYYAESYESAGRIYCVVEIPETAVYYFETSWNCVTEIYDEDHADIILDNMGEPTMLTAGTWVIEVSGDDYSYSPNPVDEVTFAIYKMEA